MHLICSSRSFNPHDLGKQTLLFSFAGEESEIQRSHTRGPKALSCLMWSRLAAPSQHLSSALPATRSWAGQPLRPRDCPSQLLFRMLGLCTRRAQQNQIHSAGKRLAGPPPTTAESALVTSTEAAGSFIPVSRL